jgi:hypothetical protein
MKERARNIQAIEHKTVGRAKPISIPDKSI